MIAGMARPNSNGRTRASLLAVLIFCAACSDDPRSSATSPAAPSLTKLESEAIPVSTLDALYSAVNNPLNAGKHIVVAPGVYMLDGTRSHGGRIELQTDMTLSGQVGHQDQVIIDGSNLSAAALTDGTLLTGAVRMGRGSNIVEWLTVRNVVKGASAITTDFVLPGVTVVTIAHVVARGNVHGFDIRNTGAAAAGRSLEVLLTDNELADNLVGVGQGMRIGNLPGANGAHIHATLTGNYAHGNIAGCLAANQGTLSSTVEIESMGDRFNDNGNGVVLLGGFSTATAVARDNLTRFSAHTSQFEHNTGPLGASFPARFGVGVYGGISTTSTVASDNTAQLELHSVKISDNGGPDVAAWGAISSTLLPSGAGNLAAIVLQGSSKKATVSQTNSSPIEPSGTNQVTIAR
jgi:hypothetical protein